MSNVELVIKIDEKIIQQAKHYHDLPYDDYVIRVAEAVANGTPLEEHCDNFNNLCKSCTNIGCEFQSGIVRTKCAFYMPPHIEPDSCGNYRVLDIINKYRGDRHET